MFTTKSTGLNVFNDPQVFSEQNELCKKQLESVILQICKMVELNLFFQP